MSVSQKPARPALADYHHSLQQSLVALFGVSDQSLAAAGRAAQNRDALFSTARHLKQRRARP